MYDYVSIFYYGISIICNAANLENTRVLINSKIHKLCYIQSLEYHTAMGMDRLQLYIAIQMTLKINITQKFQIQVKLYRVKKS